MSVTAPRRARLALDRRVSAYSKVLGLDAGQQSELRAILVQHDARLRRIWSDSSLAPETRIQQSRVAADMTADRIRAILTDEQRKKYNPPRPHDSASARHGPSVEDWMDATAR